MTPFVTALPVRFGDCDAAGIGYFPRLLALVDAAVEDWTHAVLGVDRATMHAGSGFGLPTVSLSTRFDHPCRLGEVLALTVAVRSVGTSSIVLDVTARVGEEPRFSAELVQVLIRLATGAKEPWPADWRRRLGADVEPALV